MIAWLLVLAIPLIAYQSPSIANFGFSFLYLLLPIAAYVGKRLGKTGVVAIAIVGIPFIVSIVTAVGALGGSAALYVLAIIVARIAASPRPLVDALRWPQDEGRAWWATLLAPFLLVIFFGMDIVREVSLGFGFPLAGYFLLFVLGTRGANWRLFLASLALVALLSWILTLTGLRGVNGDIQLTIGPLQPSVALAACAMYSAGDATGACLRGKPVEGFWAMPYLAIALLLLLWLGPLPISRFPVAIPQVRVITLLQVGTMLPLAAFMSGLLLGRRGVLYATALVTGLLIAWPLLALAIDEMLFRRVFVPLEAPFLALAYAALGMRVAAARDPAAR